ncbi:IMS domain-containing protein [Crocosphaera sp. UHCC 0190]|uniref:IMS domain-containing protein n=1 Tax=Crocosphaera sp. UHCC 0190 TaxID=3110246 RepID=UPI002B1F35D3|nr:IMS domain-containing protein [Crocosphaera sp. UHCC 0190]MEA5508906.1 IMS domain-containing protein [Crocosphaera sp. UHCC 0190]
MRIPLDYYRILGIFPQATDEQLRQAYRDRSVQLPRREYSQTAIKARKQLLDKAYGLFCDPGQKAAYEAQFLQDQLSDESVSEGGFSWSGTEPTEESSSAKASGIEIEPQQLPGSLLILQELGEYELVIKFGERYLNSLPSSSLTLELTDTAAKNRADTILSIALAYLEISREQWQQEKYDKAAVYGVKGLSLLGKNSLFPGLQSEIQTELDKLRPYRILELLVQPETKKAARETGIELLKSMLQERQGIDGRGDDGSGLGIDDFLRFIQQIRTYLTAQEQQDLFLAEAQRPSSVAAYLGVYALIARGFAKKEPALMVEAQTILDGLEQRQDVSIEQAICGLLLGQTQTATQALERCQDQQALKYIQDCSQGSPDLLPGLCLYGEHWLQTEVFSHFRDLAKQRPSLKEYFADQEVQVYLEQLTLIQQEKEVSAAQSVTQNRVLGKAASSRSAAIAYPVYQQNQVMVSGGGAAVAAAMPAMPTPSTAPVDIRSARRRKYKRNYQQQAHEEPRVSTNLEPSPPPPLKPSAPVSTGTVDPSTKPHAPSRRRPRRTLAFSPKMGLTVLGGLGLVGLSVAFIHQGTSPLAALEKDQYGVSLHQSLIEIPPADAQITTPTGMLTTEGATQVVEMWLSSKAQAFGKQHDLDALNKILVNPLLSQWRDRAEKLKQNQNYWTYQHQVKFKDFQANKNDPNKAIVEANVQEVAQFYQQGQKGRAYNDNLQVRYDLVRQGDRWLIQNINVIN